ncbi:MULTISPECIES: hypothetical protein [unclassified Sphingomonas]|uniref:hypothetical protein n=1 Tax=unclassified Sphingomonas TaxID=196159 RepID=UPI0022B3F3E6|nr:hypothetical protein [Sphingomonas sp. NIBR02145]WHU01952.1 hypothetical protein O3305_17405 [Sphingomonas sp. NIBR02145]|eukprot:TRINITY_DN94913_c0_g1_i1.p1 TRINITY_DN94913_c0_g1~~TRINITY_DN94913_c0_g1_i1.p1  ORF type:complete len:332 (+),score=46.05 TRINITY_DN94913_c0_g1_i1:196-1191(+)
MLEEEDAQATGAGEVTIDDKSLMGLTTRILKAVNSTSDRNRVKKDDLPGLTGLTRSQVNAILNPDSQRSTKISLESIAKVVDFGQKFAGKHPDEGVRNQVSTYCSVITQRLHGYLERGGLNPTELAFVVNLQLDDDHKQRHFSERHAGVYALVRLDREGHILISRLDIFPRVNRLCRFATDSKHPGTREPTVEGFVFAVDDVVQAVGRPDNSGRLRTSILRSRRHEASWDLMGLRLGTSDYDGGPYAYRIYCRRIAGGEHAGKELPDWARLFGARKFEAIEDIEQRIQDIGEILKLLKEEEDEDTPWGIRIPTGIMSDDNAGAAPASIDED